ncbi:unnamed protein product, partial [Polarella glacialis]
EGRGGEPSAECLGYWPALISAALSSTRRLQALPGLPVHEGVVAIQQKLPRQLRPLDAHSAIDVCKLAELLASVAVAGSADFGSLPGVKRDRHLPDWEHLGHLARKNVVLPNNNNNNHNYNNNNDNHRVVLPLHELLSSLSAPEAAFCVRREVQRYALEAVRFGRYSCLTLRDKLVQIHDLALLEWAGASWSELDEL